MRLFPPVLANLLLLLGAFGVGSFFQSLLPKHFLKTDRIAATVLGGLGLLGTLLFVVGLLRFSLVSILAVLLPAALLGLVFLKKWTGEFAAGAPFGKIPLLPVAVIALVLLVTFLGGLAEPVGDIKLDAIAYHFLGPRVWLVDAVIHPVPDECLTAFPAVVETLFAAGMAIGGARAPELFAFVALGLLLLAAHGLARRLELDSLNAWWVVALVAAMPVVYRGSYGGFNDAIFAGFLLLALRLSLDASEPGDYVLAGLFTGLALGTKYTGIITFLVILVCVFLNLLLGRTAKWLHGLRDVGILVSLAGLVASPWYLRNWVLLGSPIYPPTSGLLRLFPVKYMSSQAIDALAALVRKEGLGMGHSFGSFLLLPFHLTFHPANFLNGAGGVGVALLALAPFGLLSRRRDLFVRILAVFVFLQTLGWFLTEQEARFLIQVFVILACFAVWGWNTAVSKAPRFAPFLSGLAIACSILYGLIMIVPARVSDIHAALSPSFEKVRKAREVPFLDSFDYLNQDQTVNAVLIPEPHVPAYYLKKPYLKPLGRFGEETLPQGTDLNRILADLPTLGITHILDVNLDESGFRVPQGFPGLTLVFSRKDQRIYRLTLEQLATGFHH